MNYEKIPMVIMCIVTILLSLEIISLKRQIKKIEEDFYSGLIEFQENLLLYLKEHFISRNQILIKNNNLKIDSIKKGDYYGKK